MFNLNTHEPRRSQFWTLVIESFPIVYLIVLNLGTSLYIMGITNKEYLTDMSMATIYLYISMIGFFGIVVTCLRHTHPRFDTWWNADPSYRGMYDANSEQGELLSP